MLNTCGLKAMLCFAFAGQASIAFALQPPTAEQIAQYKKDGTLAAKVAAAKEFGNHIPSPDLIANMKRQTDIVRLMAKGYSRKQAAEYAPPPARRGFPTTGNVKMFVLLIDFSEYPAANLDSSVG